MSDFFDNEVDLEEENQEKKIKKKNGLVKIAVYLLCVAVIACSCFLVVRFIPKKEKKDNSGSSSSSRGEIKVLDLDTSKIKSITVQNTKGTLKIYSEKENDTEKWYVDGVKKELISTYSTSLIVGAATNVSATKKITKMTVSDCGLDAPSFRAEISGSDNSVISFSVGKDAAVGEGCYFKLDGKDEIYLVDNSIKTDLDKEALDLAEADTMPAVTMTESTKSFFENGELYSCESMTVTGKNYPKPLVIVRNDDAQISDYLQYKTTSPDDHLADHVDGLFTLFANGVTAGGAYSFDAAELSRFGLDKPDITVAMKLNDKTYTFKFSKQDEEYYAGWCNEGNFIYKVSLSNIESVINSKATDYYSSLVCLYSIDDLTSFTVKTEDASYSFGITANSDTEAEDKYIVTYGGKNIDCKSFQNFYEFVISTTCDEFETVDSPSGDKITVEFAIKAGGANTVEFVKVNETRYQYSIGGKPMGQVSSTRLKKIIKYAGQLSEGKKLSDLN